MPTFRKPKLQNKIRRADPECKEELRQDKAEITAQITELRKRRNMAINIEARSTHIDTMMTYLYENEMEAKNKTQSRTEMKMEAMSRQGQRTDLTSTQVVSKLRTNEIVGAANGDSREQVRRYIRLTYLIPEILRMVDEGRISLPPPPWSCPI